jgi:copper chaperone CopZ
MEKAYGNAAKSYVLNLVKDVNGRPSDGGDPNILMKWMRAAKTASVGSSLRVATLQITSYPRASLVLSPKSLALGLSKVPQIDKAKKYCGIALWKSFGFYDTNISRSIEDQMKGVKDVKVDVPTKTVTVTFDPAKTNEQTLTKAFEKIKIKVTETKKK